MTKFDSIIFDCDGVLIDITESYDKTIDKTCGYLLKKFADIDAIDIDSDIIDGFKSSGGFNDEVDLTYASILSLYSANKLQTNPREFIFNVINKADQTGILSVEKYLKSLVDISQIKSSLGSLEDRHSNLVYSIFDQFFFGPELYPKLFGKESSFKESGMIENDKILVSDNLLGTLHNEFGEKIAIVSGRGIESIRYSLKTLLDSFNVKSSVFLEDEPRELAKPNPASLIRSIDHLNSKNCLYVGDSMEDYIMAKEATLSGHNTSFCGIIGTSKNPERKRELFQGSGVELVIDSINELPKILNLVS